MEENLLQKTLGRRLVILVEKKATTAEIVLKEDKTHVSIVVKKDINLGIVLRQRLQWVRDKLTEVELKVAEEVLDEVEDEEELLQLDKRVTVIHCVQPTAIDARFPPIKDIHVVAVTR